MSVISEEMVERAARAIAVSLGLQPDECREGNFSINSDGTSRSECHCRVWELYRPHARAALEAVVPMAVAGERERCLDMAARVREHFKSRGQTDNAIACYNVIAAIRADTGGE